MKLYKIKNSDGNFCNGRKKYKFYEKGGKIWWNIKDVILYLAKLDNIPEDWFIIMAEYVPICVKGINPTTGEEYDYNQLLRD